MIWGVVCVEGLFGWGVSCGWQIEYNDLMQKSWLWIGLSCVVAGGALAVLLLVGQDRGGGGGALGGGVDGGQKIVTIPRTGGRVKAREMSVYWSPKKVSSYEGIWLHWKEIEEAGDNISVGGLTAKVVLEAGKRIMLITADRGQIYMPNETPKNGTFRGHVRIAMFEKQGGVGLSIVDTPRNPALVYRAFLEEAYFDLELNSLRSEGPIRFVGRAGAFTGVGLTMAYNNHKRRIEKFEVDQGGTLRVGHDAVVAGGHQKEGSKATELRGDVKPRQSGVGGEGVTGYRLSLFKDIGLRGFKKVPWRDGEAGGDEALGGAESFEKLRYAGGQRLNLFFTSALLGGKGKGLGAAKKQRGVRGEKDKRLLGDLPGDGVGAYVKSGEGLFKNGETDFVLSWEGQLSLKPFVESRLLGDEDVIVEMLGQGSGIEFESNTGKKYLEANAIYYQKSSMSLRARGGDDDVYYIGGEDSFRAKEIWYAGRQGKAGAIGPGAFKVWGVIAEAIKEDVKFKSSDSGKPKRLTLRQAFVKSEKPVTVTFDRSLAVTFFGGDEGFHGEHKSSAGAGLLVKEIVFDGATKFEHPLFELSASKKMVLGFQKFKNLKKVKSMRMNRLDALGDVKGGYVRDGEKSVFSAKREMSIGFDYNDAGKMFPKRLDAVEDVLFAMGQTHGFLARGDLHVTFAKPSDVGWQKPREGGLGNGAKANLPVELITGGGGVTLSSRVDEVDTQGKATGKFKKMRIVADRLRVDMSKEKYRLWGKADFSAQMVMGGYRLVGPYIEIDHARQRVDVKGEGFLEYLKTEGQLVTASRIDWGEKMFMDNLAGRSHFLGSVKSVSRKERGQIISEHVIRGRRLDIEFKPVPLEKKEDMKTGSGEKKKYFASDQFFLTLRKLTLYGGGFDITKKLGGPGSAYASVISAEGEVIGFRHSAAEIAEEKRVERITISGKQSNLYILDRKPAVNRAGIDAKDRVAMQGSGTTRFDFDGELVVDLKKQMMTMDQSVHMRHLPISKKAKKMHLRGHRLVARMHRLGGLRDLVLQWRKENEAKKAGQEVESKFAIESLEMLRGKNKWTKKIERVIVYKDKRQFIADRMMYDAGKNLIIILPMSKETPTEIYDNGVLRQRIGGHIWWNLQRNEFEVVAPGAITRPLGLER